MKPVCLVTGGTGLLGKELIPALCESYRVYALIRPHTIIPDQLNRFSLTFVEGDLAQFEKIHQLPKQVDTVIHLAQSNHFRNFPECAEKIFQVNTFSLLKLLEFSRNHGVRKFIYTSTGGVYGGGKSPFEASQPIILKQNLGFYQNTKLCAELIAYAYHSFFKIITLRPFFVYGKDQKKDMLIPRLIENVIQGNSITLEGKEGLHLNPIHVSDAADFIKRSTELKKSAVINIAGSEVFSLRQLVDTIGKIVNRKPSYEIQLEKEPQNLVADIKESVNLLGIEPRIRMPQGIEELYNHRFAHA